jgi:hypothetical protein
MHNQPYHKQRLEKDSSEISNIQVEVENPFPGLRPFSIDDSHLFFGREGQIDEILSKLARNRFVTVMGYSGSGKSSLMSCGLVLFYTVALLPNRVPNGMPSRHVRALHQFIAWSSLYSNTW